MMTFQRSGFVSVEMVGQHACCPKKAEPKLLQVKNKVNTYPVTTKMYTMIYDN